MSTTTFTPRSLSSLSLVKGTAVRDTRGRFRRNFCASSFAAQGLPSQVRQINISENVGKYTLRGFHWQAEPHGEWKLMTAVSGSFFLAIIDLRKDSKTFLQSDCFSLSRNDDHSILVPAGCATAYLTQEPDSIMLYEMFHDYHPDSAKGLRWNDPQFQIPWPAAPLVISDRDKNWPDFSAGAL